MLLFYQSYNLKKCILELQTETQLKINKNFERKIANISLPINFNISLGCSKERSHCNGSFEYPQHVRFWLKKQNKSTVYSRYLEFQGTEQNMSSYQ